MKKTLIFTLLLLLVAPAALVAQTAVDQTAKDLDSLSAVSFNTWRASPDLKGIKFTGDPSAPGFDDSAWGTITLRQRLSLDSCWMRKEIVVPPTILGKPVKGSLRLLMTVDDFGYLYVNGESRGRFEWDGSFELTKNARPGDRFVLALKVINTGGPMRLLRAEITTDDASAAQQTLRDFALSLRVGQKLLGFDTYQTNATRKEDPGIDRSATNKDEKVRLGKLLQTLAARVDVDALKTEKLDRCLASIESVRKELGPIKEFVKRYTLFFDSNAHIDAAWLWREKETIMVCHNTFASVFNMMAQRPDFTYSQSAAAYYEWMRALYPDIFKKIQDQVKNGRWEIVGGMWVEPDCNLPGGESWARHLLYGKGYFRQHFSTDVKIGWNPDSFGYNLNMPLFYQNAGIDAFITQKIGWNDTNVFPYRVFWWESPDGSRILSYFPFDYVNTIDDPFRLVDWSRQFDANTGFTKMLILFGVGDHGGGPSLEMLSRIDRLGKLDIYPTIEYGTTAKYLSWLKSQNLNNIPTWKDELYLEYHQGTFTTQAAMKKFNRQEEVLLTNAEKMSTLASLSGRPYNTESLASAWKDLLLMQFHDILPGSSIREVYIDATETHQGVQTTGKRELNDALQYLAQQVNTSTMKKGTPAVVFNPLGWERTDVVRVPISSKGNMAVFDSKGRELVSQVIEKPNGDRELMFIAERVPAMGYATFEVRTGTPAVLPSAFAATAWSLENEFFSIAIDKQSGWLQSIVDKRNGKNILQGPGNELQLLEDLPSAWDAWNIGLTGRQFPSTFRSAELIEQGPIRTVVRLTRDYLKPGVKKDFPTEDFPSSFFTQDIILYRGLDRVDFVTNVDWWEDKTMLKVAFPVAVSDTAATYEIPYGTIRRSTQMRTSWDKAKVEVPAERWADLSSSDYGVSLLNNSKYGYDIKGNVMRLSLLRSPLWPDPTADRGKHEIQYALYPHAGRWSDGATLQRGYEFNVPLLSVVTGVHRGTLDLSKSFVTVAPANLVLTTMKKAEEGNAWVIQWYDAKGMDTEAVLTLPKAPKNVVRSNFLEEDGASLPAKGNTVRVPTGKHGVVTVKVTF